ncbi:lysosomal alpha-mannosidase precursor [Trypanosoma conorhini]|uniref:Lysosomal alpha-mannosidase n=1 Tax=Trypanosoma conorhini TaxID=83891 RepID=A0A422N7H7_9TRYP|nr:lysosomal alpha-mannosidase precursor [Trypanosoma conorhini]RNF01392.1 lysosomal alpha-mannosidase precursor [Trypanosoma conorhini]
MAELSECGRHYGPPLRVRGTLSFAVSKSGPTAMRRVREQQDEKYFAPLVVYSSAPARGAPARGASALVPLSVPLPPSLQLLTLQLLNKRQLLLRLGHRYAVDEDPERSLPVEVDLPGLLSGLPWVTVLRVNEVSLTAAELLQPRVHKVTIRPMDIRTFIYHIRLY